MTKVTKRKKLPAKKGESYKERILKRIKVDQKSNCWNYTGTLRNGYGFLNYKGKNKSAHRIKEKINRHTG